MFSVTVRITGLDATQAKLTKLAESFRDFETTFVSLAAKMMAYYRDTNFNSEGLPLIGQRWAPLKQSTENEKNRLWPGRGILERTGTMRDSFRSDTSPIMLFISNSSDYFVYHQLGTGYKGFGGAGVGRGNNLPARKMLGINPSIELMIREEFEVAVREKISAAGA